MKEIKKHGFTLAEILITLSIIGVVAALTIPTLIQRTGNEEAVSRLLKAYSTLSQATEAIMTENGGVKTWALDDDSIYKIYKEHLRNARDCGTGRGCFSQGEIKMLNGNIENSTRDEFDSVRRIILSDGTQVEFNSLSTSCSSSGYGSKDICAWFVTDINGAKTPNTLGRDVFMFVLKESGLYPAGCDYEGECLKADGSFGRGWGCACKVISEGAMNY